MASAQGKINSLFKGRKGWFILAVGCGLIAVILIAVLLSSVVSTTKYYVLKQNVPSRTLITPDLLEEVVTTKGGEPKTALTPADVSSKAYYTKVDLQAGDIVTDTNSGDLIPLTAGIPSSFVVGSFAVQPNNAAAGQIKRGDYIDVYLSQDDQSSLVLQRVLVLQAQQDLENGESDKSVTATADTPTAQYNVGIPYLYTVGVSQQDAAKLAILSSKGSNLFVTLSSSDSVQNGAKEQTVGNSLSGILNVPVGDSGKGTDNTFTQLDTPETSDTSTSGSKSSSTSTPSASPSSSSSSSASASPSGSTETKPTN